MPARDRLSLVRLLALAVVAAGLAACGRQPPAKVDAPRPVRTVVVEPQSAGVVLTLPGDVRPRVETRYGFRVGGKIAQRLVSAGDRVLPGTVLARLDPQDIAPAIAAQQAQVEAARTESRLADADLARQKDLRDRNFISQAQLDRQQASADAALARLRAAEAQLRQVRNAAEFQVLQADVAGVVTAIEAEAGQVVVAGQPVVRVAATAEKEVLVNVPEKDFERARQTRAWNVVLPGAGGRSLQGRLRELSPLSDPASRTYPMRLTLLGDTAGVELGMTAVVQALGESAPAFVLPLTALYSKDGQPSVWVVDPATRTVKPVAVTTAGYVDDAVRVTEGLKPGDRVVTAGAAFLVAGQPVRLAGEAAAAQGATAPRPAATSQEAPAPREGAR